MHYIKLLDSAGHEWDDEGNRIYIRNPIRKSTVSHLTKYLFFLTAFNIKYCMKVCLPYILFIFSYVNFWDEIHRACKVSNGVYDTPYRDKIRHWYKNMKKFKSIITFHNIWESKKLFFS